MSSDYRLSSIRKILGLPQFEAPGVMIFQVDALAALKQLSENTIDLTVTSPPYNIGKEYETILPLKDYLDWTEEWINEVHRVTDSDGAFWLNLGYLSVPDTGKAIPLPYLIWDRVPFYLIQEIVWNYGAGVANKNSFSPRNEKFLWYVKNPKKYTFNLDEIRDPNVKYPNQKKKGKLRVNPLGKNPTDVWQFPKVTTGEGLVGRRASRERTCHPAQFPEDVIERIIRACSNPGDVLLDPFIGSGTTAKVASKLGRAVIGFELNPEYVDIAKCRLGKNSSSIESNSLQPQLFFSL